MLLFIFREEYAAVGEIVDDRRLRPKRIGSERYRIHGGVRRRFLDKMSDFPASEPQHRRAERRQKNPRNPLAARVRKEGRFVCMVMRVRGRVTVHNLFILHFF